MTKLFDYLKSRFSKPPAAEDRRAAPRFPTTHLEKRLVVNVSLLDTKSKPDTTRGPSVLAGYTHDVSEVGMGIVVPDIRIGSFNITRPGRTLRIALGIPGAPIEMHAVAARFIQMEKDAGTEGGYLIGIQITNMSERDRSRYLDFLNSLKIKEEKK
jgi:PilZ domain